MEATRCIPSGVWVAIATSRVHRLWGAGSIVTVYDVVEQGEEGSGVEIRAEFGEYGGRFVTQTV